MFIRNVMNRVIKKLVRLDDYLFPLSVRLAKAIRVISYRVPVAQDIML